jgi:threonine dehydrogenase-like Zn-dependent dehydrogenase
VKSAFRRNNEIRLREIELPGPAADEILVRVDACGVCGTDLEVNPSRADREIQFGHEVAGTVEDAGAAAGHLKAGTRVVLDSSSPCGRCAPCRDGRQDLCADIRTWWTRGSFGFAERMLAPAACAIPCDDLPPDIACLQEPLGVALDMVRLAEIAPGSNVLVIGAGPIGLAAVALGRRAGARRVFVSDLKWRTARVELAGRFGADEFLDPRESPLSERDFGCRLDRVLVTAPPAMLPEAVRAAGKGAIISFIGIAYGDAGRITIDANEFHFKKLQLRGSFASPALYGPMALDCLRERVVDGEALVSHRFRLDDIAAAVETARSDPRAVKVVVVP